MSNSARASRLASEGLGLGCRVYRLRVSGFMGSGIGVWALGVYG